MKRSPIITALLGVALLATSSSASEHPGKESLEKSGYQGPETCEECHPGTAKAFLGTVHWKHASKVTNVEGLAPDKEYGMKNRIYVMCNGNDIVNNLKEIPKSPDTGKTKFAGCNTCHPGNHLSEVGSTGPEAEKSVDCLVCHSSDYDFRQRKAFKDDQGRIVMGQDRSKKAALAIGKPTVKNCMVCHEAAGGGVVIKRGFSFTKDTDAHAAKGMVCVDCHRAKKHLMPTGLDPNNWASDGLLLSCADASCHGLKPHRDADLNRHTARIACQTCHIPRTGGAFAKDFTVWEQSSDKFYEPTTLKKEANETTPALRLVQRDGQEHPALHRPEREQRRQQEQNHAVQDLPREGLLRQEERRTALDGLCSSHGERRHTGRRRLRGAHPGHEGSRRGRQKCGPRLADHLLRQQPPGDQNQGPLLCQLPHAQRRFEPEGVGLFRPGNPEADYPGTLPEETCGKAKRGVVSGKWTRHLPNGVPADGRNHGLG